MPFARPVKVYTPAELAVVVAEDVPVKATVVPEPPLPLIVPVIENVCGAAAVAAKFAFVMFAVVIVSGSDVGLKVKPVCVGVTV